MVILTFFGTLVCFSTVLWVIVVKVTLSDCLSGQLHSHLVPYFINFLVSSIESALSDWHCLIGKLSNLIYIGSVSSWYVCLYSDFWVSLVTKLNCQIESITHHTFLHIIQTIIFYCGLTIIFWYFLLETIIFCFHGYHTNLLPLATIDLFLWLQVLQEIYKIYKIYLSICFIQMVTSVSLVTGKYFL